MGKGKRRKTVVSRKTAASNVELLLRWIPAPALDPDPGYAGMTMPTVMPDSISLPCEILFCFVFNRACPVLDAGASRC